MKGKFDKEPFGSLILKVLESITGVKSGNVSFTNRRIRDPYVRWCESLNPSYLARIGLLDYLLACFLFSVALFA